MGKNIKYTTKEEIRISRERYNLLYWLAQDGAFTDDYIADTLLLNYERHQEMLKKLIDKSK